MRLATFSLILGFLVSACALAQPIDEALREPNPDLARLIEAIKADTHPGYTTEKGASYLHLAARRNLGAHVHELMKVPEIRKLLLKRNDDGLSAIEEAIIRNRFDAFKALLSYFVCVDKFRMLNEYEWSLMHLAAAYGRVNMIVELHKAGHSLDTQDKDGWKPRKLASAKRHDAAGRKLGELLAAHKQPVEQARPLEEAPPLARPAEENRAQEEAPKPEPFILDDEEEIGAAPLLHQTMPAMKALVAVVAAGCVWVACGRLF